jgi:hypothetical protein
LPGKRARPVLKGPRRSNAPGLPDEGWWRLLRRAAFAGQSFADTTEITHAVQIATVQLNTHAKPWIWGRQPPPARKRRRTFVYRL